MRATRRTRHGAAHRPGRCHSAPSSVSRLVNIGIEPYLIAASLNGILAQRLVRRICSHCKETCKVTDSVKKFLDRASIQIPELVRGKGCDKCRNSGYAGRAGIFELLVVDEEFRRIINEDSSVSSMRKAFVKSGWPCLFDDGLQKVKKGITTIEEVLRVTEVSSGEEPVCLPSAQPSDASEFAQEAQKPAVEKKKSEKTRRKA